MLLRVTTLSAAAMCSQLYIVNAVVTSELFPTAVRNLAASFGQIASRTGAIMAPHLFYLAVDWSPLPFLLSPHPPIYQHVRLLHIHPGDEELSNGGSYA